MTIRVQNMNMMPAFTSLTLKNPRPPRWCLGNKFICLWWSVVREFNAVQGAGGVTHCSQEVLPVSQLTASLCSGQRDIVMPLPALLLDKPGPAPSPITQTRWTLSRSPTWGNNCFGLTGCWLIFLAGVWAEAATGQPPALGPPAPPRCGSGRGRPGPWRYSRRARPLVLTGRTGDSRRCRSVCRRSPGTTRGSTRPTRTTISFSSCPGRRGGSAASQSAPTPGERCPVP